MEGDRPDSREVLAEMAAIAICLWTGYFLCHTWRTLSWPELALAGGGAVACSLGAHWLGAASGRTKPGAVLALAGLGAVAFGNVRALWGAVPLGLLVLSRGILPGTLAPRFVTGWLVAAAAALTGLVMGSAVSLTGVSYGVALAGYVGLAGSIAGPRPVSKGTFAIILAALLAAVLLVAGFGLTRPFGLLAAAFSLWLAVYLGWYGRQALKTCDRVRLRLFAQHALLGAGFFAGSLLTLEVRSGRPAMAELAWPVALGGFSVVMIRVWPYLGKRVRGPG